MAALTTTFRNLAVGGKDWGMSSLFTQLDAFIKQRGIDLARCLFVEAVHAQVGKYLIPVPFLQDARDGWPTLR